MEWHYCFQYVNHGRPRHCIGPQITYVIKPLQEQYVNETIASGFLARPGNGAYFHSCHSGGYWVSAGNAKLGEWNMISVDQCASPATAYLFSVNPVFHAFCVTSTAGDG